ncbi:MAG: amidohydrolase family protein [Clostridia bacterium]|nr:amidohydrolase family protein [Clostridia bacterium]
MMTPPCKKIDIHAHVTPAELREESNMITSEDLLPLYDELNIEMGVILPFYSARKHGGVNTPENARLVCERYPERFARFTSVDLSRPEWTFDALERFLAGEKEAGALGVGEITTKLYFDDPKVDALFSLSSELELPLLFHVAPDFEARYGVVDEPGLVRLEKMLKRHPKALVLGHSQPFWKAIGSGEASDPSRRLARLMRECPNLLCDLSAGSGSKAMMRDRDYAAAFLTEFSHRVFYGCDICQSANSHFRPFAAFFDDLLADGMISEETYRLVARENALRVLFERN